jgi:periplasmic protein TonB
MDTNNILLSNYLDLIFDGRNKNYGSYELRKNYSKRVGMSLLILFGIGLFAVGYSIVLNNVHANTKPDVVFDRGMKTELSIIDIKKPELPQPSPPAAPKPTVKFTPPIIEIDKKVTESQLPPEQAKITSPGVENARGDSAGIDPVIKGATGTAAVIDPPPQIHMIVEQMPEPAFDLESYLSKNLRYPDLASENGIAGKVGIKFVVNEDGTVSDVQVMRGIGGGCDEEAKRVVGSMPKWKPGKQNGKPVKVYFQLPINFKLE